jgi:catalase
MNGYGSHTYLWINAAGEKFWVKYHFHTEQGMAFFTNGEAAAMAGSDADFHRRDLFQRVSRNAMIIRIGSLCIKRRPADTPFC